MRAVTERDQVRPGPSLRPIWPAKCRFRVWAPSDYYVCLTTGLTSPAVDSHAETRGQGACHLEARLPGQSNTSEAHATNHEPTGASGTTTEVASSFNGSQYRLAALSRDREPESAARLQPPLIPRLIIAARALPIPAVYPVDHWHGHPRHHLGACLHRGLNPSQGPMLVTDIPAQQDRSLGAIRPGDEQEGLLGILLRSTALQLADWPNWTPTATDPCGPDPHRLDSWPSGPAPAAHKRASTSRDTASSWRTFGDCDISELPTQEGISKMQLCHRPSALSAAFDDPNLIASAGLIPAVALADRIGLPAAGIGRRPTVKVGLHLRYPPPRTHPILPGCVVVGRGVTIRWRIFRHYSLQSLLDTTAALRPVPGSPGPGVGLLRLLRRLRPTPDRSADGVPSPRPRWPRGPRADRDGSRVHLSIARRRRHPTRPLRHRRGYPAARHHGLPHPHADSPGVPRLRDEGGRCASHPAQIRQVRAGASLRGVERRFLAYAFPSRSPHPRRLAVPARHGFVRAAPTHPGTSRDRLPSASPSCCDRNGGAGLSPPLESTSASRRTWIEAKPLRCQVRRQAREARA